MNANFIWCPLRKADKLKGKYESQVESLLSKKPALFASTSNQSNTGIPVEKASSRNKRVIATFVVIASIMLLFGVVLLFRPETLVGKEGFTIRDLQTDYEFKGQSYVLMGWRQMEGNFRSFQPGDTVLLRDKVIRVELSWKPFGGGPVTNLFFEAYPCPSYDRFAYDEVAKLGNSTWYVALYDSEYRDYVVYTNFPVTGENTPELIIGVDGNLIDEIHVNSTVEIACQVYDKFEIINPTSPLVEENIREFKFLASMEDVNVLSSGIPISYSLYAAIPLICAGFLFIALAMLAAIKPEIQMEKLGGIAGFAFSCTLGIVFSVMLVHLGGWVMNNFAWSAGALLSMILGGSWIYGFALAIGLITGVIVGFMSLAIEKNLHPTLLEVTIGVLVGTVVTLMIGSILFYFVSNFLILLGFTWSQISVQPPTSQTLITSIISLVIIVAGIVIPFVGGGYSALVTMTIVDGIIEARATSKPIEKETTNSSTEHPG